MTRRDEPIQVMSIIVLVMMLSPIGGALLRDGMYYPDNDGSTVGTTGGGKALITDEDCSFDPEVQAWPGNGTKDDPYIVENQTFNGTRTETLLSFLKNKYYVVRNNTFFNGSISIYIAKDSNKVIENNTIYNNSKYGIFVDDSSNTIIRGNRIFNQTSRTSNGYGVYLRDSNNCTVVNNTFSSCRIGIYITDSDDINISGNSATISEVYMAYAINVVRCDRVNMTGNSVGSTPFVVGFQVSQCTYVKMRSNNLSYCSFSVSGSADIYYQDIDMDTSNIINGTPVLYRFKPNNTIFNTSYSQFIIFKANNVTIDGIETPTVFAGAELSGCKWTNVTNCRFISDVYVKVRIHGSDIRVENCTFRTSDLFLYGNRNLAKGNSFIGCRIRAWGNDNAIEGNRFTKTSSGIDVSYVNGQPLTAKNLSIADNTFVDTRRAILIPLNLQRVVIVNNTITNGSIIFPAVGTSTYKEEDLHSFVIPTNNTVDGRPVLFLTNVTDRNVTNELGELILVNCSRISLDNISFGSRGFSVFSFLSDNVSVERCSFNGTLNQAFAAQSSSNVTISNCSFSTCARVIVALNSRDVSVLNCSFTDCYQAILFRKNHDTVIKHNRVVNTSETSIELYENDGVEIRSNDILNSSKNGIKGDHDKSLMVTYNRIQGCKAYGILLYDYTYGEIKLNEFLFNRKGPDGTTISPQCFSPGTAASWDNGSVGNYWSDFQARYPTAKRNGTTWDTPYGIDPSWGTKDHFPLVFSFDDVSPVISPYSDIATNSSDPVVFDASGASDDVGIHNVTWSFVYDGSQRSLYGHSPTFKFDFPGAYRVSLRVADTGGNNASTTFWVNVTDNEPPVIVLGEDIFNDMGTNVTLDGSGSHDHSGISDFNWTFLYNGSPIELDGNVTWWVFDIAGTYNVTLNVTDVLGHWATDHILVTIRDTAPPVARAGDDMSVDQGTNVTLNGTASTDNVGIISYVWEFTYDGLPIGLNGSVVHFVFDLAGVYKVNLTIADANNNTNTASVNVTVRDIEPPVARVGSDMIVDQGTNVTLDGNSSTDNVGIVSYLWEFTYDGLPIGLNGSVVHFVFDLAGVYKVNLTIADAYNNTHTASVNVTVRDIEPPVARPGADIMVDQGTNVTLDGTSSTDNVGIVSYLWEFTYDGLSISLNGSVVHFVFDLVGVYKVNLTVADMNNNTHRTSIIITVRDIEPPVPDAGEDVFVDQGTNVTLDGSASSDNVGIMDWTWTFVYGVNPQELRGRTVHFVFDTPGVYIITLNVTDASGLWATDTLSVTVRDTELPVAWAGGTIGIPQDTNLTLNATRSTDNVGIVSYTWTFEYDGETVTLHGPVVSFIFHIPGDYEVNLTVEDAAGNSASELALVIVTDTEPPIVISPEIVEGFSGEGITLDASASTDNVGITSYTWTFVYDGETVTLTGPTPEFTFDIPGQYNVLLEVADDANNVGTLDINLVVWDANAPAADAGSDVAVDQGDTVTLDGSSSLDNVGIIEWIWTFEYDGEDITLLGETAEFTFHRAGVYDITLTVLDGEGLFGVDTVRVTVRDTEPPVADAGQDIEVGEDEVIILDASMSRDNVGITIWSWAIRTGDNTIVDTRSGKTTLFTLEPGLYTVTLTVVDAAGNEAHDTVTVLVKSANVPVADAGEDATVEAGDVHTFDGTRTTAVGGSTSYTWTFQHDGQDIGLTGPTPEFTFVVPGVYDVTLTVIDNAGNFDMDQVTIFVEDTTPPFVLMKALMDVSVGDTMVLNADGAFDNVGIVNWTWRIVHGNEIIMLYDEEQVEFIVHEAGTYKATLTVKDAAGNDGISHITFEIPEEDGGTSTALIIGAIVAVVVVAVVAMAVFLHLRGKGPSEGA